MCKCGYTHTPHHSSLCSSLPVCRWCSASEETLISDRLLGTGAKLRLNLKPTCDEWQRLLPLAKGNNALDDRGRGDKSGDIAPARLHQTCTRTTSPVTLLAPLPALAGSNPAHSTNQSGARPSSTWHFGIPGHPQASLPLSQTGTAAHFQALPPKEAILRDRPPLHRSSPSGPHPPSHLQRA